MTDTTYEDTALTWRDLIDELDAEQIADLEEWEAQPTSDDFVQARLIAQARRYAKRNMTDRMLFGHMPTPTDARETGHWRRDEDDERWYRFFDGTERVCHSAECECERDDDVVCDSIGSAEIVGTQFADGFLSRHVQLRCLPELDAPACRRLAAALLSAAEELDRLHAAEVQPELPFGV